MLKKIISLLTAAAITAFAASGVFAQETKNGPELTHLLYKLDLSSAQTPSDAGVKTPAGEWTVTEGSEGKLCLKSTDKKASLIVGDDEWQNYKAVISYKMVQSEDYPLAAVKSGSPYNLLRVSVCPRNIDNAESGKWCKYIYTNPPRYSGHYLEEYYYDGTNSSVRYSSTDENYKIDRNAVQTIVTTNYNAGENVKFITSVNGKAETDIQNVYHNTSSTNSKGPLAVIFEDVISGYNFADTGYAIEVYGIEIYGEKPEVVPIVEKSYTSSLYASDFENNTEFAQTGITAKTGTWELVTGSEGTKCIKGTLSGNTASLLVGNDNWTDCDVEIEYKYVQDSDAQPSTDNKFKTTVFTRSGDSLGSGNFVQYRFDNAAYYSNYFGGYSKNGTDQLKMLPNFKSGTNESASIKKNSMQRVHVSDINRYGTGGATIVHSVEYSNGTDEPYTNSVTEWAGNGSGILNGKVGVEFMNAINNDASSQAYVEVYSIKVTGTKTFSLAYLNEDETALTELVPNAEVTVAGDMSECLINSKTYENPIVVTAVYDQNALYDVNMVHSSGEFSYTVNLPNNTENCVLKTFVWGSFEDMYPLFETISDMAVE